jgi:hypothetical protein
VFDSVVQFIMRVSRDESDMCVLNIVINVGVGVLRNEVHSSCAR